MNTHKALKPGTILLVDDDSDCRMLIRDAILQDYPAENIREMSDGEQALAYLACCGADPDTPRPELIYLDIEMPGLSGQEVLKMIKSDPGLKDIPVVMVTGLSDDVQKWEAARNGANSYTIKPTDPVAFLRTILEITRYWLCVHQYPKR